MIKIVWYTLKLTRYMYRISSIITADNRVFSESLLRKIVLWVLNNWEKKNRPKNFVTESFATENFVTEKNF